MFKLRILKQFSIEFASKVQLFAGLSIYNIRTQENFRLHFIYIFLSRTVNPHLRDKPVAKLIP
jgi:hypothetical protein